MKRIPARTLSLCRIAQGSIQTYIFGLVQSAVTYEMRQDDSHEVTSKEIEMGSLWLGPLIKPLAAVRAWEGFDFDRHRPPTYFGLRQKYCY